MFFQTLQFEICLMLTSYIPLINLFYERFSITLGQFIIHSHFARVGIVSITPRVFQFWAQPFLTSLPTCSQQKQVVSEGGLSEMIVVVVIVQSLSCVRLFVTPWTAAYKASLSFPISEPAQTQVHQVSDAIQPSHPLSFLSPPAFSLSQHQGIF